MTLVASAVPLTTPTVGARQDMAAGILAYKFRLYPTRREVAALEYQLAEACRLYNAALQERRDAWKLQRKTISFREQDAQLKDIRAAGDVGLPTYDVATDVLRRVDLAFKAFWRRVKAKNGKAGFPRFRARRRYNSISFPHYRDGIKLDGSRLRVSGVGSIRTRVHREPKGSIKRASVVYDAGKWYVVLTAEVEPVPLPVAEKRVGLDVGLSSFVALSDGSSVEAPKFFRSSERRLRRMQRKLARCQRGSKRRERQRLTVARALARVRHQRADFQHKLSRQIVNRHQVIAVEDLNISGLARTRLAKSIHDAAWASFIDKLAYKAERAGRQLVKVDPRGTSQVCLCGASVPKELKDRWHECSACGLSAPRDVVSARVILARGAPSVANAGDALC